MSAVRHLELGNLAFDLKNREDGSLLLTSRGTLEHYPPSILERLKHWAETAPDRVFMARRNADASWRQLTYRDAWQQVQQLASGLEKFSLSADRPLAILSGNSIEHALLALAAMYIGVPFAPISPQYSLVSSDYAKLKYVLDLVTPGLVFADQASVYGSALKATVGRDVPLLVCDGEVDGYRHTDFDTLRDTPVSDAALQAHKNLDPDTPAKFLFSSGSTGMPKAVINTHRMISANQQMILQALPFLKDTPILVDWLPWNHTFGGNHNVGIALYNGGSYYIDDGKPTPKGIEETVCNLKEVAPTVYFNVPKGFEELVKHMRHDKPLRERFFSRVKMLFYAGAGLSQPVWDALDELALQTCGERIMIVTGLGCTETSPSALFTTGDGGFAGWLGSPLPGLESKLVKVGGKVEIRFRGDSVTPGYWRNPEITGKSFDEEGYFCTGDAVKFLDENDIQKGLVFDGRISEDFKLNTGTWVSAGPLRARFLNHFGNLVKDVVIVGRDRASVGALVFPDMDNCREFLDADETLSDQAIVDHPRIREKIQQLLSDFAGQTTGSASRIDRLLLQAIPPSLDRHEMTDKGSLNASAIQDNRSDEIDLLYQSGKSERVIYI